MQPATFPRIQQWNTKKICGILTKWTMKTPEESHCFLMSPCQWGCSRGYSSMWICFNIYLFLIYFIWCMVRCMMRQTQVPPNITRSTKLQGAQHSPELAVRSTDFCVPENLIFPALTWGKKATCLSSKLDQNINDILKYKKIYSEKANRKI